MNKLYNLSLDHQPFNPLLHPMQIHEAELSVSRGTLLTHINYWLQISLRLGS